jgi:hypothetical protein
MFALLRWFIVNEIREREREIHPYYDEDILLGPLRESHTHAQSTFIHSPVDEERESSDSRDGGNATAGRLWNVFLSLALFQSHCRSSILEFRALFNLCFFSTPSVIRFLGYPSNDSYHFRRISSGSRTLREL